MAATFEEWIQKEYTYVSHNMIILLKPAWDAATRAAEEKIPTLEEVFNGIGYCGPAYPTNPRTMGAQDAYLFVKERLTLDNKG